jgi:hypothetical protein
MKRINVFEMDDLDRELLVRVRLAIEYVNEGHPAKDAIDEIEMIDAMRLLLKIIDAGHAA